MGLLTKEQLREPLPKVYRDIPAPEFGEGCTLRLQKWTGDERDEWDACRDKETSVRRFRASAVAVSVVDESGSRVFDCNGDVSIVQAWDASLILRAWDAVDEMNHVSGKALEESEKNLPAGQSAGSGSS